MNSYPLRQISLVGLSCFLVFVVFKPCIQAQDQFFPVSDFWNYDGTNKVDGVLLDSITLYNVQYLNIHNVSVTYDSTCVLREICRDGVRGDRVCIDYLFERDKLTMTLNLDGGYNNYILDSLRRVESQEHNIFTPTGYTRGSTTYKYHGNSIISCSSSSSYQGGTSSGNSSSYENFYYSADGLLESCTKNSYSFSRPIISYDTVQVETIYTYDDQVKVKESIMRITSNSADEGNGGPVSYDIDTSYSEIHFLTVEDTLVFCDHWKNDLWDEIPIARYTEEIEYRVKSGVLNPYFKSVYGVDENGNLILESTSIFRSGVWEFRSKELYKYNSNNQILEEIEFNKKDGNILPNIRNSFSYDNLYNLVLINEFYYNRELYQWIFQYSKENTYHCNGAIASIDPNSHFFYKPSPCSDYKVVEQPFEEKVCEGEEYLGFSETGYYQELLCSDDGNDTLISITLNVKELSKDSLNLQLCEGEIYNGYSESGRYEEWISTSSNGCDSIFILNLEVAPIYFNSTVIELCPGENYESYDEEGIYIENYTSILGCDSIEQLELVYLDETDPACQPSSIADQILESKKLKVFPNPTTGTFRFSLEQEATQVYQLSIYSTDMELVTTQSYRLGEDIDVSYLSPSIYILNVSNSVETYTTKIVKVD